MFLQKNCQSRKSILAWIDSHKENYVQLEMKCDSFSAETKLNEIITKYENVIDTIMQEYRECEKIDSAKMRKTYSAIDFLLANKRIKKNLFIGQTSIPIGGFTIGQSNLYLKNGYRGGSRCIAKIIQYLFLWGIECHNLIADASGHSVKYVNQELCVVEAVQSKKRITS